MVDWKKLKKKATDINEKINTKETRQKTLEGLNNTIEVTGKIGVEGLNLTNKCLTKVSLKAAESSYDLMSGNRTIKCPKCKSANIDFVRNDRKEFSKGKAALGMGLTGGSGLLAGFAGKKGKDMWHCKNCGTRFKK